MSQSFRLSFDKPLENKSTSATAIGAAMQNEIYEQEGYGRNICFVKQDGNRIFLSYGHLISAEYNPDENIILLIFTSHCITLKGICLDQLYYQMMQQLVKQVICVESRYNVITDENNSVINEIICAAKEA